MIYPISKKHNSLPINRVLTWHPPNERENLRLIEGHREMAPLSQWLRDRQSLRKWRPYSRRRFVLQFPRCESAVTVQREFRRRCGIDPPGAQIIRRWYRQFEETGCLCKGKSTGRPHVTKDNVQRIRVCLKRSPRKPTNLDGGKLGIPQTNVWRLLRRRLIIKPYRINNFK